jgi:hypothetical protein
MRAQTFMEVMKISTGLTLKRVATSVILIIIIGSTALHGPWLSSEASVS